MKRIKDSEKNKPTQKEDKTCSPEPFENELTSQYFNFKNRFKNLNS